MSGPVYLVAPQFARLNESGTHRDVYLPQLPLGEVWVDDWTNVSHGSGGRTIVVETPLDRFGLLRREQQRRHKLVRGVLN
jgi:alpha-glucosidase (family GH31 glycosyl hydrolase)